ncbi:hypothetical protein EGW08_023504 [Elysia chlorotica]|uniref:Fibrinogen C-terminal domain-containing protein n=1 Tax=Elysia chlorotica TaxID=188477 RepID=A0A3S1AQ24_ELYCH|nr:hypothetical protein EGW08_023504 [Elysia chlorotica]
MALRDLFTTARLVTLLVMATAATGLVQKQSLNVPTAQDSSSTSLILMKLERLDAKIKSIENGLAGLQKDFTGSKRSAIDSDDSCSPSLELLKKLDVIQGTIKYEIASLENRFANTLNYTLLRNMQSTLSNFFWPQSCKKNARILSPSSTPYSVIYNNEYPGVDTPLLCDTVTDGGGWIVIQRRSTGDVNFYRNWASYKAGFGTLDNDFWLGNDNIHTITSTGNYELRVDLKYKGQSKFARYGWFNLISEDDNYRLQVASYSGTAGDSLKQHNQFRFSTFDNDFSRSCANSHQGAWWYARCMSSNLNGRWGNGNGRGLVWSSFTGQESATFSEMKIRRN